MRSIRGIGKRSIRRIRRIQSIQGVSRTASILLWAIAGLILVAGCGQRYIKVNLERPGSLSQPAWVGVYFLSQESALDGLDNRQLADPDAVAPGGGVVRKEVIPLYPGGQVRHFELKPYQEEIQWVVVAAGFPDAQECALRKIQVPKGAKLTINVSVTENCVNVDID